MATIQDYLIWRGDLPFSVSPFNEIDGLILCQIAYLDFSTIIPADFKSSITIAEAAQRYMNSRTAHTLGMFINEQTPSLLAAAGTSIRFSTVLLQGFIKDTNYAENKQFSALTARIEKNIACIVFRGTDDTLIGWKEDCLMALQYPIPSQKAATAYLVQAAAVYDGTLFTAGHSKGGNLAVYAAGTVNPLIQERIQRVFCYDGPGFNFSVTQLTSFTQILPKVSSYIPQSSVVGVLLNYVPAYCIVLSTETTGIRQHDAFSWQLEHTHFIICTKRSKESLFIEQTVKTWLDRVDMKGREAFISALFSVLYAGGADTLTGLAEGWLNNSFNMLKQLHTLESSVKKEITAIIAYFFKAVYLSLSEG